MEYNCGFTKDNRWFRYRAAAIIVEDGCVLFAGNENKGSLKVMDLMGVKENMYWLPIEKLDTYKAFPAFMKDYLKTPHSGIEHIVTDERV